MIYSRLLSAMPRRAGIALCAGLAMASGCNRDNPSAQAIEKANQDLVALAPGGQNPPSPEYKTKVYNGVVSNLKLVSEHGSKPQNAAAALLISQAQAGLADEPASTAVGLEVRCLSQITEIRSLLGQWLAHNGRADAGAAYDPSKELADIEQQLKAREQERIEQQRQKGAVDKQVADILAQSKSKSGAARAKQQEAGALRAQVPNQTAVQGEQTLKQAQEIARQADALEVEAANLEAEAAKIAPQSGEIQLQIDRLSSQKELLEKARTDIAGRAKIAADTAAEQRAEAAKVAGEIRTRAAKLDELRAGDLSKAAEDAVGKYTAAAASAKKATSEARSTGQMAFGAAEQSLGDVQWGRAQGLMAYADLLDSLAGAKPPLPEAASYKSKADEARAAAKAALEAASEAYEAADTAYKAGGGATDKDRMDRINAKLAKAVHTTSGGSKDIRNPDAPKDETPAAPAEGSGAAAAPAANSPQATVQALFDIGKNKAFDSGADLFLTSSDEEKQALRAIFSLGAKGERLKDALKAKFGADGEQAMTSMAQQGGGAGAMDLSKFKDLKASDLTFNVQGDTAETTLPNGQALKLKQKDGKWLIDGSSMGMQPEQLAMVQAMVPALGKAMDDTAAEVEAGKYPSAQAAMAAFMTKMMGAMGGALPKMPGGKK